MIAPPVIDGMTVSVDGSGSYDPDAITPPGIVSWSWNWGDMTMDGSGAMATHTYAMGGDYTITLTVKDVDGLEDTETALVHIEGVVDPYPVASFTATMDWMTVTVISTSTDNLPIPTTSWAFGDGATATGLTATHTYAALGLWTITLTVTDSMGQMDTATQQVEATDPYPVASLTAEMNWMSVTVTSTSTDNLPIPTTSWAFGDGATATGLTATHKYGTPGLYTITLTVTDSMGQMDTATQQVEAKLALPLASFTQSVVKRDVSVDGSASSDPDGGAITAWSWNWGDGSTLGSGAMTTHLYASIGTFTITLTVTDDDGQTGSSSQQVTTSDSPPIASFTWSANGAVLSVDASGSSDDYAGLTYSWKWGDATMDGSGMTATHTYAAAAAIAPAAAQTGGRVPGFPYPVIGYTFEADGTTKLPGCAITIQNGRTLESYSIVSDLAAYYSVDLNEKTFFPAGWLTGDPVLVSAVKGDLAGSNQGSYDDTAYYISINVNLISAGPVAHDYTVTLTVTDVLGQTAQMTQVVTVYW
jgi:PKD repeat protein